MACTSKFLISVASIALLAGAIDSRAAAADADTGNGLEEIVITAQKRAETLQRAPLAATALDAESLKSNSVSALTDLTNVIPDLHVSAGGTAGDSGAVNAVFSIRGLGASGTGPQGSAGVAVLEDGNYLQIGLANDEFFDIKRIEVLPGPQGTLYGRAAAAGAINIITNGPTHEYEGAALLEGGSDGLLRVGGMLNIPVNEVLAVRGAFQYERHDGYMNNGYDDADNIGARASALLTPNDDLSIKIGGEFFHAGGKGNSPLFVGPAAAFLNSPSDPYKGSVAGYTYVGGTVVPVQSSVDDAKYSLSADISYDFGPATLTVLPAYHYVSLNNLNNPIASPYSTYNNATTENWETVEVRLSDNGDSTIGGSPLKWVVGANFYTNTTNADIFERVVPAYIVTAHAGPFAGPQVVVAFDNTTPSQQDSYAAFGQATYSILDWLRVTGGARYDYDGSSYKGQLGTQAVYIGPSPSLIPAPILTPVLTSAARWWATSWKLGIDADVAENSLVYASVGTGDKPGGLNDGGPANSNVPPNPLASQQKFAPEKVTHYEIGTKNRFLNNRLQINDAFYFDDYKNYQNGNTQVVNPLALGAIGFIDTNAGHAQIYGNELSANYLLTPKDSIDASFNYLHATFLTYSLPAYLAPAGAVPATNYNGYKLPNAPNFSGSLGYQHIFDFGDGGHLTARAATYLSASYWVFFQEAVGTKQSGYSKTTLTLTYESPDGMWSAQGYVKNLEDNAIKMLGGATPPWNYVFLDNPRTFGAVLSAKF